MKITIEIDQKELRELLGKGEKEETISKKGYIMYFHNMYELCNFIEDANHIIDEYGYIGWHKLLAMHGERSDYKSYSVSWNKKFTFNGEHRVEIYNVYGGRSKFKLVFPRPDVEL